MRSSRSTTCASRLSLCSSYTSLSLTLLTEQFQDEHTDFSMRILYGADVAVRTAPSAPYTRPLQRLSRPPSTQKLGAENHMLQLNI